LKERISKKVFFELSDGEMKTKEKTQAPGRVGFKTKRKLAGGNRLDSGDLAPKDDKNKADFEIKKKLEHWIENKTEARSRQKTADATNDLSNQANLAVDEFFLDTSKLWNRKEPGNRKNDLSSNTVREKVDGKHTGNLTSIAPRVEIQDKRMDFPEADEAPRIGRILRYFSRAGEDVDMESSLENRPMTVEMEVEIPTSSEGKKSHSSAAMKFARRLDSQIGEEIVRQIKIVLNRASAGELRINLRPENLGRVRVEIQLEDNNLSGRFFVETPLAREVFKGALEGLQTKLLESGFGAADLEMAWDDASSNFGFGSKDPLNRGILRKNSAVEFEDPLPTPAELDDNIVNLFV